MRQNGLIFIGAVCAGAAVSIGGTVYLSVENTVIGSVLFSVGLYAIVLNGWYLYTGKIGYLILQKEWKPYLVLLGLTWAGNLAGAMLAAGVLGQTRIRGIEERAAQICQVKLSDGPLSILILSVFCGILMYVAVEGFRLKENPLILMFCVSVFILCGFEHCIANMFYLSMAGMWSAKSVGYLLIMTLGNSLGAVLAAVPRRLREIQEV